jgi:NAD(P)-dependent dehydrogenase (short-subunit alcohol dehydrogenase family)
MHVDKRRQDAAIPPTTTTEGNDMSKIWLITGSSRGLGRALAREVLEAGHSLVATARRPEQLSELVAEYGDRVRAVALDVTDEVAAQRSVQTAVASFGRLDVVVNNAGYANSGPVEETSMQEFRSQIEANLFGVISVTKAALPVLREQRSGHFVQVSSVGGRVGGTAGLAPYQTAKFGVEGFSLVLRSEVAPLGIRVMIVEPGALRTDWGGSSMHVADVGSDYEQTVGRFLDYRREADGNQPGDPARAARVIREAVDLDEAPLRLLLGSDAVELVEQAERSRAAETKRWEQVGRSIDYATSSELAQTPITQLLSWPVKA